MLHLHEGWLKAFDGVQDLLFQKIVLNDPKCFLKNVVAKLVVDQALHDEVNAGLQGLRATQGLHQLAIIVLEGPFEDLVDVVVPTVQAFFNHVGGEFQLA